MRRAALLAAACALIGAPAAEAQFKVVSLPWPPVVLPKEPPLAPTTTGLPPAPLRFLGRLSTRERIEVGIDAGGSPSSVRVLQTITLGRLGDYVLGIPAPVRSVTPGPGTQSAPGQRENQILWEGFSPGRRVLAAWADLRVEDSADSLPLRVRLKSNVDDSGHLRVRLTATNVTGADVESFTADPDPLTLAQVLDRIHEAIKRNVFAEGVNVGLHGASTPVQVRVAAPLRVDGTLSFPPGTEVEGARNGVVRFSGLLDGVRRTELRVELQGRALKAAPPKVELRVIPADVPDRLQPPSGRTWVSAFRRRALGDRRSLLARAIDTELTYARKRQYDMFLTSPDPTGPGTATYVYRTASAHRVTAISGKDKGGANVGLIVLAIGLALAVPAGVVVWAHS